MASSVASAPLVQLFTNAACGTEKYSQSCAFDRLTDPARGEERAGEHVGDRLCILGPQHVSVERRTCMADAPQAKRRDVELVHDALQLVVELAARRPAQRPDTAVIQAVAHVLPRSILDRDPRLFLGHADNAGDAAQHVDIAALRIARDIVDRIALALLEHGHHGLGCVLDVQPGAHEAAVAVHDRWQAAAHAPDALRDQLLRILMRRRNCWSGE